MMVRSKLSGDQTAKYGEAVRQGTHSGIGVE